MKKLIIGFVAFLLSSMGIASADSYVTLVNYNNDVNYYYQCQGGLAIGPGHVDGAIVRRPYIVQFGLPLNPLLGTYQLTCHGYENGMAMIGNDYLLVVGLDMNIILASGYEVDAKTQKVHTFLCQGGTCVGSPDVEPSSPSNVK